MLSLIDAATRKLLLSNGRQRDRDHSPVVKLFNPMGPATWLPCELDADGDTLFGLCDLGVGEPELGYVSLEELKRSARASQLALNAISRSGARGQSPYMRVPREQRAESLSRTAGKTI
ncbi:Protein of unknown function [Methylobacterium pseudosasicola]|uniref:DUF2958 domain-containing protein n=1 Tax=Methylobacterium pseudosasicola TaxID=582667 RepID=A0A1I4R258_9HYPH|nr:Protein of unknown function [Methylobacterium pseudosasicola]